MNSVTCVRPSTTVGDAVVWLRGETNLVCASIVSEAIQLCVLVTISNAHSGAVKYAVSVVDDHAEGRIDLAMELAGCVETPLLTVRGPVEVAAQKAKIGKRLNSVACSDTPRVVFTNMRDEKGVVIWGRIDVASKILEDVPAFVFTGFGMDRITGMGRNTPVGDAVVWTFNKTELVYVAVVGELIEIGVLVASSHANTYTVKDLFTKVYCHAAIVIELAVDLSITIEAP